MSGMVYIDALCNRPIRGIKLRAFRGICGSSIVLELNHRGHEDHEEFNWSSLDNNGVLGGLSGMEQIFRRRGHREKYFSQRREDAKIESGNSFSIRQDLHDVQDKIKSW
jgi:hypothetical protein